MGKGDGKGGIFGEIGSDSHLSCTKKPENKLELVRSIFHSCVLARENSAGCRRHSGLDFCWCSSCCFLLRKRSRTVSVRMWLTIELVRASYRTKVSTILDIADPWFWFPFHSYSHNVLPDGNQNIYDRIPYLQIVLAMYCSYLCLAPAQVRKRGCKCLCGS
jgi:hypothetical protein